MAFSSSASKDSSRIGRPAVSASMKALEDRQLAIVGLAFRLRAVSALRSKPLDPSLRDGQVGKHELEVEALDIAPRIDRTLRVRYRRILERSHDVEQRLRIAESGEVLGRQLLGADPSLR